MDRRDPALLHDARADPTGASAVGNAEHAAALVRFRSVLGAGVWLWLLSCCSDVYVARAIAPHALRLLLTLRFAGSLVFAATWLWFRAHPRPSRTATRAGAVLLFTTASSILSVMGLASTGVATLYANGVVVVLVIYAVTVSERWTLGVWGAAGPALAYPVATLVGAAVSPNIAAELRQPFGATAYFTNCGNMIIAYVAAVLSGHVTWALRRQVFEARNLGRYKLKRQIGAGGMGEVWLAHHAALKRDVAIKVLRLGGTNDASAIARFEREVRATTALGHPNTIRIFDYGVSEDGVCYYAMELLEGETLSALAAREGPLPVARAIHLVGQAARALAEAHAKGVVHRDVKPENLFVVTSGGEADFVKVLDFGIARVNDAESDAKLTRTGALVGTPAWIAPEAITGASPDARADVYQLGAVLYLLLAGRGPFEDAAHILVAHMSERPAPPTKWRGEPIPADAEAVVMRCLEKDPAARYASARELADALAECADAGAWRPGSVHVTRAAAPSLATDDTIEERS
jgi:serine/threonine-protein kinase